MYEAYWKLKCTAFDAASGGGWFYESPAHEEALARLQFVVENCKSCGILTGSTGTGKSTLLARLTRELRCSQRQAILVDVAGFRGEDILRELADRLHLGPPVTARPYQLWRGVRDYVHGLSRAEQQIVFLFDHLDRGASESAATIEQLLHVIDEFSPSCTLLAATERADLSGTLAQLTRLAGLNIELPPLTRHETFYYVYESLKQAGAQTEVFEPEAIDAVHAITGGAIRDINRVCELALLAGMADEREQIDAETVIEAADNLPHAISSTPANDKRAVATA